MASSLASFVWLCIQVLICCVLFVFAISLSLEVFIHFDHLVLFKGIFSLFFVLDWQSIVSSLAFVMGTSFSHQSAVSNLFKGFLPMFICTIGNAWQPLSLGAAFRHLCCV